MSNEYLQKAIDYFNSRDYIIYDMANEFKVVTEVPSDARYHEWTYDDAVTETENYLRLLHRCTMAVTRREWDGQYVYHTNIIEERCDIDECAECHRDFKTECCCYPRRDYYDKDTESESEGNTENHCDKCNGMTFDESTNLCLSCLREFMVREKIESVNTNKTIPVTFVRNDIDSSVHIHCDNMIPVVFMMMVFPLLIATFF